MTDLHEFTDEELRSFDAARDALRAALPSYGFLHTEPVRNPSGVLYLLRAYHDDRLLAEVTIQPGGSIGPVRFAPTVGSR